MHVFLLNINILLNSDKRMILIDLLWLYNTIIQYNKLYLKSALVSFEDRRNN